MVVGDDLAETGACQLHPDEAADGTAADQERALGPERRADRKAVEHIIANFERSHDLMGHLFAGAARDNADEPVAPLGALIIRVIVGNADGER